MNYFFNPKARAGHLEHVAYYQSQRHGLGAYYLAALRRQWLMCTKLHRRRPDYWLEQLHP